ncbi:putative Calpain-type cysteine protease ADL1 [Paratrimastix pyriformis]|uniref:Calpain-type cysteine protease ADL1 n=1 Tax=Paratrimastix pyriformis TaxID=342808 RepID=A0ABQ8V085_9EUKA|nr:putative Calpain-type cysteine protease ADL1 [Paratrimastix pyriformis]
MCIIRGLFSIGRRITAPTTVVFLLTLSRAALIFPGTQFWFVGHTLLYLLWGCALVVAIFTRRIVVKDRLSARRDAIREAVGLPRAVERPLANPLEAPAPTAPGALTPTTAAAPGSAAPAAAGFWSRVLAVCTSAEFLLGLATLLYGLLTLGVGLRSGSMATFTFTARAHGQWELGVAALCLVALWLVFVWLVRLYWQAGWRVTGPVGALLGALCLVAAGAAVMMWWWTDSYVVLFSFVFVPLLLATGLIFVRAWVRLDYHFASDPAKWIRATSGAVVPIHQVNVLEGPRPRGAPAPAGAAPTTPTAGDGAAPATQPAPAAPTATGDPASPAPAGAAPAPSPAGEPAPAPAPSAPGEAALTPVSPPPASPVPAPAPVVPAPAPAPAPTPAPPRVFLFGYIGALFRRRLPGDDLLLLGTGLLEVCWLVGYGLGVHFTVHPLVGWCIVAAIAEALLTGLAVLRYFNHLRGSVALWTLVGLACGVELAVWLAVWGGYLGWAADSRAMGLLFALLAYPAVVLIGVALFQWKDDHWKLGRLVVTLGASGLALLLAFVIVVFVFVRPWVVGLGLLFGYLVLLYLLFLVFRWATNRFYLRPAYLISLAVILLLCAGLGVAVGVILDSVFFGFTVAWGTLIFATACGGVGLPPDEGPRLHFSRFVFPVWAWDNVHETVTEASLPLGLIFGALGELIFWGIAGALFLPVGWGWVGLGISSVTVVAAATAAMAAIRAPNLELGRMIGYLHPDHLAEAFAEAQKQMGAAARVQTVSVPHTAATHNVPTAPGVTQGPPGPAVEASTWRQLAAALAETRAQLAAWKPPPPPAPGTASSYAAPSDQAPVAAASEEGRAANPLTPPPPPPSDAIAPAPAAAPAAAPASGSEASAGPAVAAPAPARALGATAPSAASGPAAGLIESTNAPAAIPVEIARYIELHAHNKRACVEQAALLDLDRRLQQAFECESRFVAHFSFHMCMAAMVEQTMQEQALQRFFQYKNIPDLSPDEIRAWTPHERAEFERAKADFDARVRNEELERQRLQEAAAAAERERRRQEREAEERRERELREAEAARLAEEKRQREERERKEREEAHRRQLEEEEAARRREEAEAAARAAAAEQRRRESRQREQEALARQLAEIEARERRLREEERIAAEAQQAREALQQEQERIRLEQERQRREDEAKRQAEAAATEAERQQRLAEVARLQEEARAQIEAERKADEARREAERERIAQEAAAAAERLRQEHEAEARRLQEEDQRRIAALDAQRAQLEREMQEAAAQEQRRLAELARRQEEDAQRRREADAQRAAEVQRMRDELQRRMQEAEEADQRRLREEQQKAEAEAARRQEEERARRAEIERIRAEAEERTRALAEQERARLEAELKAREDERQAHLIEQRRMPRAHDGPPLGPRGPRQEEELRRRREEEQRALEEAAEMRRQAAEAAEAQRKADEAQRRAEEARRAEEDRLADEAQRRQAEEARRREEERKRQEEAARQAAERARQEVGTGLGGMGAHHRTHPPLGPSLQEARRRAEEARRQMEAERRRVEEARRKKDQEIAAAQAAEQARIQAEKERLAALAAEQARLAEAKRLKEERERKEREEREAKERADKAAADAQRRADESARIAGQTSGPGAAVVRPENRHGPDFAAALRALPPGTKYSDPDFPANAASLGANPGQGWEKIVWKRPEQLQSGVTPALFPTPPNPDSIQQGGLGDCWFLSAASVIAREENRIRELFVHYDERAGIYVVRFMHSNEWHDVVVDDQLPADRGSRTPKFASTRKEAGEDWTGGMWVSILEKAYAKLNHTYHAIEGGVPGDALSDMTGGYPLTLSMKDPAIKKQIVTGSFWAKLVGFRDAGYLLGAGSPEGKDTDVSSLGIVQGHAYSILAVQEEDGNRLIRLRNPWGQTPPRFSPAFVPCPHHHHPLSSRTPSPADQEWKGEWSDSSAKWTARLREKFHVRDIDDGSFWMSLRDFCVHFDEVYVCKLVSTSWTTCSVEGAWKGITAGGCINNVSMVNCPQYLLTVTVPTQVLVIITQPDTRGLARDPFAIGVDIWKNEGKRVPRSTRAQQIISGTCRVSRQSLEETTLQPGAYTVVAYTFNPGEESPFWLTVHGSAPIQLAFLDPKVGTR